ncbi:MAG TPA: enolase C-terminal domain-like protein [Solirubrobacteraceae bacterium]|nr:enolase C-terminal domain-like protein [Solirubrobacteraceae bacterium]
MKVSLEPRVLRFAAPLRTAYGELSERELIELRLECEDGAVGVGEAAPLEPYDGVSTAAAMAALEACRPLLEASDGADHAGLIAHCARTASLPQALAAIDLALWDLAGRRADRPVAALLNGESVDHVAVNATIGAVEPAAAAAEAAAAVHAGFRCVKLKVGSGDDAGRVAAVRAAIAPEVALRVDANGAWSVEQAIASLEALAEFGLELVEEPVHGIEALRRLRGRTEIALTIDETAACDGAITSGAADGVCLKLSRCGGITGLLDAALRARSAGGFVYLSSTFDGPLGIAAALHAASALAPLPACGLATLSLFEDLAGELQAVDGSIAVPSGAGLGVQTS